MENSKRRRDKRYRLQIPLVIRWGHKRLECLTQDVSYRGLFVEMDDPPRVRELIQIEAFLPPDEIAFASHGMTVWALRPEDAGDRAPGAGIQFYAMGQERPKWEMFINHIRKTAELVPDLRESAGDAADPINRKHPRFRVRLEVKPRTFDELMTMYSRDVSRGGMFLATPKTLAVDTELQLDVKHPEVDLTFSLEAIVRRVSDGSNPGIGIEFQGMGDRERDAFYEFIHTHIPDLDEIELVDSDDPHLE